MQLEYGNLARQQSYSAAIYCRLSRDDGTESESNSIQTQKQILRRYAKESGYHVYDEYVDDGYSGTNFDRPDFKRMMNDIETGRVNTVLTKDLSRLGRNNALVAHYTEIYFPENDVRYVAVTDGIDTFKGDNEIMPFKSVVNEYYARDISRKTRSAFKIKAQNGEFTGSMPPYGYKKDPNDRHRLVPDEVTADYAMKIFELAVGGYSPYGIAKFLFENKVLKPRLYDDFREGRMSLEGMTNPYKWGESSVVKIIKNPVYLGHMVSHRNVTKSYKIKKRVNIPQEEWIEVKNTHEALIDESTYELAQKVIKVKKKKDKDGNVQIFSGLLKCQTCGKGMAYTNPKSYKNPNAFYVCSNSRRNGKNACSLHYIKYDDLYELVMEDLQRQVQLASIGENEFYQHINKMNKDKQSSQLSKAAKDKAKCSKRIMELDLIIKRLYEDNVFGKISDERFVTMTNDYEAEQRMLKQKLEDFEDHLQAFESKSQNSYRFLELIKKYTEITELSAPMLKELIDKIVINQSTKVDGKRMQQIDIYYRFIGTL